MYRGIGVLVLGVVCVLNLVNAVSVDNVITKDLEEVIKNEDFVVIFRHIKPRRRHRINSETLFAVDFPSSDNKFSVLLDRNERSVVIDTVEDGRKRGQHFTVDTLERNAVIPSLILAFDQKQPGAKVFLYVDCISYGMIATPKTIRDMYTEMKNPTLQVMRERKFHMEIDQENIRKILLSNNCSMDTVNMHTKRNLDLLFAMNPESSNELSDEPSRQMPSLTRSGRGDIEVPLIPPEDDCSDITSTINKLIVAVQHLSAKIDYNSELIANLDAYMRRCDLCSQQQKVATCETRPPQCFEGVSCINEPNGPKCGSCPEGYTGNGVYCRKITCADIRCDRLAGCTEDSSGPRCNPCPEGYVGNGEYCYEQQVATCQTRPPKCFEGVSCINEPDGPKCGNCPEGYTGNGVHCRKITCADIRCDRRAGCTEDSRGPRCNPCPEGYVGNGEYCYEQTCTDNPCSSLVTCTDSERGPICGECPKGYIGDGKSCEPGWRCEDNPCFEGVRCENTPYGARCGKCPHGYEGDGFRCKPFPCEVHNPCHHPAECRTTTHGWRCICPADMVEDNYSCRYLRCSDQTCYHGAHCQDTATGVKCTCPHGMTGDGKQCHRICDYRPCGNDVECAETTSPPYYTCRCPPGSLFNTSSCVDVDECALYNPCDPLVKCYNRQPGYECDVCPPGYTGNSGGVFRTFVQQTSRQDGCYDIDECAEGLANCPHGTKCKNLEASYECIPDAPCCRCPTKCDSHAYCMWLSSNKFQCRCFEGWAGDGTVCGKDSDSDGWPDQSLNCIKGRCKKDNCPTTPNSGQEDADEDGIGDSCDEDADNDGVSNDEDNCPLTPNSDQKDRDNDTIGDACDNCLYKQNRDQEDLDNDGLGNDCDNDIDGDGIENNRDNCPKKRNEHQSDRDRDGVGDDCDNCPLTYNPHQEDYNENLLGDVCDFGNDRDRDGIADDVDNCEEIPNSEQQDIDGDGIGDACDNDIDNDGILNNYDNCPLIRNPYQEDKNNDDIGDACDEDADGDGIKDEFDNCPNNTQIYKTDFSTFQTVMLDPVGVSQKDPNWVIYNQGAEITQTVNNDPGLAVGYDQIGGVDYEGTFYIDNDYDNDYAGFVFSYQSNRKFYVVMWRKEKQTYWDPSPFNAVALPAIQLKLVNSATGPGQILRNALWHTNTTAKEVKLLWHDQKNQGWKQYQSYRWKLIHRPRIGLIRLKMFHGSKIISDSGNIFDRTLKGGRLGVFSFSQEDVIWSNLQYKCNDYIPKDIYKELPMNLRKDVQEEP